MSHGVFGDQANHLLRMIATKGPISPDQLGPGAPAPPAAEPVVTQQVFSNPEVARALSNPEIVRAFSNPDVVKAFALSPPKKSATSPGGTHLSQATLTTVQVSQAGGAAAAPAVTRGPDIANSPSVPPELSKLPSGFSIFPVVPSSGAAAVQAPAQDQGQVMVGTPAPAQEADTAATAAATVEDEVGNLPPNVQDEIEPEPRKISMDDVNYEENVELMEDDENNTVELKIEDLVCSDIEEEDQDSWANQVKENRFKRYKSRNEPVTTIEALHEKTGNKEFIQDFDNFLLNIKQAAKDTHRKAKSWLFTHPKSYLKFQTSKNPQFELNFLTKFEDEKVFVEVSSPIEWQLTEAGPSGQENPSPRKEMLKHHAALRDYILYKLESCDLGSSTESLIRKERIRSNLNNVEVQLTRMKIWDKLKKQIQNEKKDKEDLKEARDPDNSTKEVNAAKTFFASQKFRELWDKYVKIWDKVQAENKVSKKDFVDFGLWARFLVGKLNKNIL